MSRATNRSSTWPIAGAAVALVLGLLTATESSATASTQVWNPSTDIQKAHTVHLGIDNYFSVIHNAARPYQINPDVGLTVGACKYAEVGVDLIEPSAHPLYLNFKVGLPESGRWPAVAVGGCNLGTKKGVTDYDLVYGVVARTVPRLGRLTGGYYEGLNHDLFVDGSGKTAARGVIATWDRALNDKTWACIDYASGNNWYGSLSLGASRSFGPNVSLIVGYVIYNDDRVVANNTITTQIDISL